MGDVGSTVCSFLDASMCSDSFVLASGSPPPLENSDDFTLGFGFRVFLIFLQSCAHADVLAGRKGALLLGGSSRLFRNASSWDEIINERMANYNWTVVLYETR